MRWILLGLAILCAVAWWVLADDPRARDGSGAGEALARVADPAAPEELAAPARPDGPTAREPSTELADGEVRVGACRAELRPFLGSGAILCRALDGADALESIPVVAGRWSSSDAPEGFVVDHLVLAGARAVPLRARAHVPGRSVAARTIDARWGGELSFDVVDDETLAPLAGVVVLYSDAPSPLTRRTVAELRLRRDLASGTFRFEEPPRFGALPDAGCTWLARDASSPVVVEARGATGTYWISARGYEWVAWPGPAHDEDDPATVRLRRTGAAQVLVQGLDPERHLELAVSRAGTLEVWPVGRASWGIPSLLPGEHVFELRATREDGSQHTLDARAVEIRPGEVAPVELVAASTELARLRGSLVVETSGAGCRKPTGLRIEQLDRSEVARIELAPDETGARTLVWDLGETVLAPGRYRLQLEGLPLEWLVALGPGVTPVRLEVTDLRERWVEVRDRTSGAPLAPGSLAWSVRRIEPSAGDALPGSSGEREVVALELAPLHLTLPAGSVEIAIESATHGAHSRRIDVLPGQARIQIALAPPAGAELAVVEDGEPVPVSPEWVSSVQALDARGEPVRTRTAWSWPGHGLPTATLWFDAGGTYTLVPPELPGLALLARAEALVREGDRTLVTFESVPGPRAGE